MNESREREEELFVAAAALKDTAEREAFLSRSCGDDAALRRRLERLVAAHDGAGRFFGGEVERTAGGSLRSGGIPGADTLQRTGIGPFGECNTRIGRYRLVERIGDGGCGVVYLAEQQEPVKRRVALKIVRLGLDTESVIRRFELERQALALMDHPNIARVLDAGATESGRPFFVMELVGGVRVTDYCDRNRLDTSGRLELFITVCHAIQHAHQKGVVHRDIKPSNVLIASADDAPVPKVIDFGIAKATAGRLPGRTVRTRDDQLIGTPAYMSPEQVEGSGIDIDTRSDIYSLGVLLYELLTGRTPFDCRGMAECGVEKIRRMLRECEPPRPSAMLDSLPAEDTALVAERQCTDPHSLRSALRGDLDWIVMKALARDRVLRYETANGLARDVRRYLDHEAVSARPPSWRYRLGKLVRRNKGVFVAGGVVTLALLLGLGTSTWMFLRERTARREQARLRAEAERARAAEEGLREEAEAREKVAQAAVQLSYKKYEEADALLAQVPPFVSTPSLESANVFRAVGTWHALAGRWPQAASRLAALVQSITHVDASDSDSVSNNLLPASTALCEAGDMERYERFRREAMERFGSTNNGVVAEQIIKATTIVPADAQFLDSLRPLGVLVERLVQDTKVPPDAKPDNWDAYMNAWRCFALGLLSYRLGDDAAAVEWEQRCVDSINHNPPREASARLVMALAWQRQGLHDQAGQVIHDCGDIIDERFRQGLEAGGSLQGFWFDWVNARILWRQADTLVNH